VDLVPADMLAVQEEPGPEGDAPQADPNVVYRRILVKLSGEAFAGSQGFGLDSETISGMAEEVASVHRRGVQVAIVVGGGNIVRGSTAAGEGLDEVQGHYMGMLATVINALALQDHLERIGIPTRVLSAIQMQAVAEPFIRRRAMRHLDKGRVVIFAAGTGNPYFTTDTAAALRASEIGADALLMAKNRVDGVYDADPNRFPEARKFAALCFEDVFEKRLQVMDLTALTHSMEHKMTIIVFDIAASGNINRVVNGEGIGTLVSTEEAVKDYLAKRDQ
jgi:uridylate kinase